MAEEGDARAPTTSPQISGDFFCGKWADKVEEALFDKHNGRGLNANDGSILHVPKLLQSGNPLAYLPHFVSLGPYHYHSKELEVEYSLGQKDALIKVSAKEAYKLKFAAGSLQGGSRNEILAMMTKMLPEIANFYHWQIEEGDYSKKFALMMMVDSIFLIQVLFSRHGHAQHILAIKCDILKLENQIPLFLLKGILNKVEEGVITLSSLERPGLTEPIHPQPANLISGKMLQKAYKLLSPFPSWDDSILNNLNTLLVQPHLLGCIHAIVSPILTIECNPQKPFLLQRISSFLDQYIVTKICGIFFGFTHPKEKLPIKTYTARELARAGVKFKSYSKTSGKIRFDKNYLVLYLPRMTVSNWETEVFFRNLLALEFVDTQRLDNTTRYIQLMLCLISSADDVKVLRKSHVISPHCLLTDEHILRIWDKIRQPFSYGHVDPPKMLKSAFDQVLNSKYYKIKVRIYILKTTDYYYKQYFSTTWSFIAFLFAFFLLAVNMLQAYCSLFGCEKGLV